MEHNIFMCNLFFVPDPESGSDFKLENFLASPSESFDPHYGR